MSTIAELSRKHIHLPPQHILHLQHLVAEWELLADLYYSDLLLFVALDEHGDRFVALAHVRPTNSETIYRQDPVGDVYTSSERPWIAEAWRSGEMVGGEICPTNGEPALVDAVPVRRFGELIAVLSRDRSLDSARRATPLDSPYAQAGAALMQMIAEGTFPYRSASPVLTETIRAGDGFIRLDADMRIRNISPNGVSALHRIGVYEQLEGRTLRECGLNDAAIRTAIAGAVPQSDELEAGEVHVLLLALPLLNRKTSAGAIVLLRDVSEIRRRDRLLLSKEAAIREIHHRVKNNLQTIASLLQLQARRTSSPEATAALGESVRRIRSIALVHELLSRDAGGWVPFNGLLQPLVRDVDEALVGERRIRFDIRGDAGMLPDAVATPMAVIITELLQNAVEHAFEDLDEGGFANLDGGGLVTIEMSRPGDDLLLIVGDNGIGFPPTFNIELDVNLGLKIVYELVTTELGGRLEVGESETGGACVRVTVPVPYDTVAESELVEADPARTEFLGR